MSFSFDPVKSIINEVKSKVLSSELAKLIEKELPAIEAFAKKINWQALAADLLVKYGVSPAEAAQVEAEAEVIVKDIKAELPAIEKELGI